ncbi:hypothetical protein KFU94_09405 [Chloroflexi bacterium TSY]|nr:hypothetical protein [Chloroflexi bacterium TSY]
MRTAYWNGSARLAIKLDKAGQTVWTRIYAHAGHGAIRSIDVTEDGGIVATGYADYAEAEVPFIAEEAEGFILRTDATGELIWQKTLPFPQGTKVKVDRHHGGFILCSTAWTFLGGTDQQDAFLIKTDDMGNVIWTMSYGGPEYDQCYDMDLTPDGYVLGGHTTSYGEGGWNAWLVTVDPQGELIWQRSFGEPLGGSPDLIFDECYGVKTTPDGGFVMACGTGVEPENVQNEDDPLNTWAAYIIRTNSSGKLLWEYTYHTPGQGHNAAEYISLTRDGGFMIFLDSDNLGQMRMGNFGFLKLAPELRPIDSQQN